MKEEEIFQTATDRPIAERALYLTAVCHGQPELRARIERLLASHETESFMQRPADRTDSVELQAKLARLIPEAGEEQIGNYKLLQKLGEGGFGSVWMAEQQDPVRRRVALKIIKLGMDTKSVIARFWEERQALAMMDHPNIAKVFDAGATDNGRPFFVMELVRGIKITDYCDQNQLSTSERLELFIAVCNAIQHAHQKGIIHRDIKPSNILVTLHDGPGAAGAPKVIDFGIAKATTGQRLTDATLFTAYEQFLGTPAYMSPEQAELGGVDIDTRSDIYSLGVLLYELLTGHTPFDPEKLGRQGLDEMRRVIREQEPLRPSTMISMMAMDALRNAAQKRGVEGANLIGLVRGDLDWIVMKALEKDRTRRYETADGLASDLQRHLTNEPVVARPPTPLYRFHKSVRRNKLAFATSGAAIGALLVGLCFASWQAFRARRAEQKTRRNAYAAEINVAFHALAENNLSQARVLLEQQRPPSAQDDQRGFEWRYLWRLCQGDELKTFYDAGARAAVFSPDGKLFAYSASKIVVRDATSLEVVATLPSRGDTLSFAPHTNLLASGNDSGVKIWDTKNWQEVRSLPGVMLPSLFSPDGRWLLTGVAGAFRLWDAETWQLVGECDGAPQLAFNARNAVAFSPDGQFLVTVAGQNEIGNSLRVWRLPGLERLSDIRFGRGRPAAVAFSADGKRIFTGLWDGRLVIQDFATGKTVATLREHTAGIKAISVASNGKTIATAGTDRMVNLWDPSSFEHLVRLRGHVDVVMSVAFSPDSSALISGGFEGETKLWSPATRHTYPTLEGTGLVAGFIGGGRQLVALTTNGWCVWTPENGALVYFPVPASRLAVPPGEPSGKPCDVKPYESLAALGQSEGVIEIWHLTTGARISAWQAHDVGIGSVAFSSDGKLLASASIRGEVKIWNFATHREVQRLEPMDGRPFCLAFSPDGRHIAASGRSSSVWLWNINAPAKIQRLSGHAFIAGSVAFSPDGTLLATPSLGSEVRLWDLPTCTNPVFLKGHVGGATAVAFSRDGKTLATAGTDMKVKLWNIATRQELATFTVVVEFPTLNFSPDGDTLAVGEMTGDNRRIQLLRAPRFEEIVAAKSKPQLTGSQ